MSSIQEINAEIEEHEKKLKELKQLRTDRIRFHEVF